MITGAAAQSNKAFLKEAEAFAKEQNYKAALERYALAIQVDSTDPNAFRSRAKVYKLIGEPANAANDLKRAAANDPKDLDLATEAAKAFLDIGFLDDAKEVCDAVLEKRSKHLDALQIKTRTCLAQGDLDCAAAAAAAGLDSKRTTDTYYLHGLVAFERREYDTAVEDFEKVIEWNYVYGAAYVGLAEAELKRYEAYTGPTMKMRTLEKVIEQTTLALDLDPNNQPARMARSKAFAEQKEYFRAIDDVSKIIAQGGEDADVYLQRAIYYQGYGQFQNAINDLNQVILSRPDDAEIYLLRGKNHEMNLDARSAYRDLEIADRLIREQGGDSTQFNAHLNELNAAVIELDREDAPPRIRIEDPMLMNGNLRLSAVSTKVRIGGEVTDKSAIKQITVGGTVIEGAGFTEEAFEAVVEIDTTQTFVLITATDIYDNRAELKVPLERVEAEAPAISLLRPKSDPSGKIELLNNLDVVLVEGIVADRSLLSVITVNGVNASFDPNRMDPAFGMKVSLQGVHSLVIKAEDLHGNVSEAKYPIVRVEPEPEPALVEVKAAKPKVPASTAPEPVPKPSPNVNSPMGLTWVVFIENAEYQNMKALTSTDGDVQRMKEAFKQYDVHNTLHKKNLTKAQLERFFNIELRDLVRKNKVNSVLVWYAGQGKFVDKVGYWIPVDGQADDAYTYFSYGGLKARMRAYSASVSHTMVVSDAAGADPSFYELTR